MLVPKKISFKKQIIYFTVMGLMMAGTIFLIYQNYLFTAKKAPIIDIPAESGFSAQTELFPSQSIDGEAVAEISTTTKPASPSKADDQLSGMKTVMDISILENKKFQTLKESFIVQEERREVGKRNPFKPY